MLPETTVYVKSYHGQTKLMYCFIQDKDLLEKYDTIWDKVSAGEPVYIEKLFENQNKTSWQWNYRFLREKNS